MITYQHSKRLGWLLAGLGACCVVGGAIVLLKPPSMTVPSINQENALPPTTQPEMVVTSTKEGWIDGSSFLLGSTPFWVGAPNARTCSNIKGKSILILPHYLPVHDRIENALAAWTSCADDTKKIRHVIVLSPDHYRRLSSGAATLSEKGYSTPLGVIATDADIRQSLIDAGSISTKDLFAREHGAGLFPVFIKKYFPDATYSPLVISNKATKDALAPVIETVRSVLERGDTLVIVTADFSHYLSEQEAEARDKETLQAFQQKNEMFFWTATDDHTDFGRGLWFGQQLAGATSSVQVLDRVNSADIGGSKTNTTSFFLGWWK